MIGVERRPRVSGKRQWLSACDDVCTGLEWIHSETDSETLPQEDQTPLSPDGVAT